MTQRHTYCQVLQTVYSSSLQLTSHIVGYSVAYILGPYAELTDGLCCCHEAHRQFLGAVAKLRKATISIVTSASKSQSATVSRQTSPASPQMSYLWIVLIVLGCRKFNFSQLFSHLFYTFLYRCFRYWRVYSFRTQKPLPHNLIVDFRFPLRFWWDLRSSGILRTVVWWLFTDVSAQRIGPIFKDLWHLTL